MKKFITSLIITIACLSLGVAVLFFLNQDANKYLTNLIGNVKVVNSPIFSFGNDSKEEDDIFCNVEPDYFDDALFIGDSRTVGLNKYGTLNNADYFAQVGLAVQGVTSVTCTTNYGELALTDILSVRKFTKVYLMFGVNELTGDLSANAECFKSLIELVKDYQPEAIIYIQANLHVGANRSAMGELYSNKRLDEYNEMLSAFADNKNIFYIDVNPIYDDSNGCLSAEYTSDDLHLNAGYYNKWCDFLLTKGVKNR